MDPQELLVILLVFGGGAYLFLPIVRALAKRIAGEVPRRDRDDLDRHEAVVAELRDLRDEVTALAERLDFTERLLAQQRDAERLAPPRRREGS